MWVGSEYTMEQFVEEARRWGVSKKVRSFPNDLKIGDIVYLGYRTAVPYKVKGKDKYYPALFFAFRVKEKQVIVSKEEAEDEKKIGALIEKGITPVLEQTKE